MQFCGFCGTELPEHARFCRNCGKFASDEVKQEDLSLQTWQYIDPQNDDSSTEWIAGIAPLVAGEFVQFPAGNVPVAPGTPQIGGVPVVQATPQPVNGPGVQATPHLAGNTPPLHELAQQAPSSPPQHTWGQHTPAPHQQHLSPPRHQQHSASLEQHPPARKLRWRHRRERVEPQHAEARHEHRFHFRRARHTGMATTSKAATGIAVKWAIVLLVAVVVLASGGIIFVLASSPALSVSSNGTVSVGGILQLHGRGFMPGGTITLTVDNGLPAPLAESNSSIGARSGAANLAGMLNTTQVRNSNGAIVVGLTGTFDANVVAQSSWPAGRNVLHAKENTGSRSADISFTLFAQPAHLVINPSALDFGTIPQGGKVAESVLIGNNGDSLLNWSATTSGSPWLSLQSSNGILQPGAAQEALYALVDTSNSGQGTYSGEIVLHSNGGDTRIAVHVRVGPPSVTKQAQLKVNPLNLDFGQLTPGQQVTNTLTIGNQGTLALQWQVSTGTSGWLSLNSSGGSVQPGGVPQNIQVTVDTNSRSLQAGSNTASITIHSNGGNVTVPVTLTLLAGNTPTPTLPPSPTSLPPSPSPSPTLPPSPTSIPPSPSPTLLPSPSPSPTFSPTPSPTTPPSPTPSPSPSPSPALTSVIQVTPLNLDPTASNCSQNSDGTYTCAVTVGENTAGNLNWFAPTGIGGTGITFSPPNGQLTASQTSQQVVISSIPCANTSFTFVDQSNNQATVTWSCTPPPPPSPTPPPG